MPASEPWTAPSECPFCGSEIPSPGKGFMIHVNEAPECEAAFDRWRDRVADDMAAGWPG